MGKKATWNSHNSRYSCTNGSKNIYRKKVEPIFHQDSYGCRPGKYDYVLELDIKGLFDNIDYELLMKAIEKHVEEKWIKLYIVRWLETTFKIIDGNMIERKLGIPLRWDNKPRSCKFIYALCI